MATTNPSKINLSSIFARIPGPYQPHLISTIDSAYDIKLAKIHGPFIWHAHPDADELFYVIKGELLMGIQNEGKEEQIRINEGEMFIVPQGIKHLPDSTNGCEVMVIEKKGTINTGDVVGSDRTREVTDITKRESS